ncbi:MAG: SUF system NifU family Fe-S cluster assembly protein [Gemmatimonadetes bacterium]|nr:SUF system NifU family Fe-S cluster assembly protein [Gemmatimonadota bacterium]
MLLLMTSDQDELFQAVIQDHFERPRNHGLLGNPTHSGAAHNPFCGDTVRISLRIRDLQVEQVGFEGRGCTISQAAASMLSDLIAGEKANDARRLVAEFVHQITSTGSISPELGDLRALMGVRRFPNRIRCATLAAEAFNRATSEERLGQDQSASEG